MLQILRAFSEITFSDGAELLYSFGVAPVILLEKLKTHIT